MKTSVENATDINTVFHLSLFLFNSTGKVPAYFSETRIKAEILKVP